MFDKKKLNSRYAELIEESIKFSIIRIGNESVGMYGLGTPRSRKLHKNKIKILFKVLK
jgi:hypothetical protein